MTKQVNQFSLEEILCTNEIKNKEDEKEEIVSEEIKNFLSNIPNRIGVVIFENQIIAENIVTEITVSKTLC